MSSPPGGETSRSSLRMPWRHWRVRAVSCRSRSGTAPTSLIGDYSTDTPPDPPCRSSGHMRSTSSCADPFKTARSSIGRLRLFSGTSSRKWNHSIQSGALTTECARWRRAESFASRRLLRLSCIGASMAGVPCTIPRHVTRRSGSMWRTFRRLIRPSATVWTSRSTGRKSIDGRGPTLSFTWDESSWRGAEHKFAGRDATRRFRKLATTGQFNAARALDRAWDSVEDQVRPRVEQDKVASHKTILNVIGKSRQYRQNVGRQGGEWFPVRVGAVYLT